MYSKEKEYVEFDKPCELTGEVSSLKQIYHKAEITKIVGDFFHNFKVKLSALVM